MKDNNQHIIEQCFSKTYLVHFNQFLNNHVFVSITIYGMFFDCILIIKF